MACDVRIGFTSWRIVPLLFSSYLVLIGALARDAQKPFCYASTVKRLSKRHGKLILVPENNQYPPLAITETTAFEVWGVVTYVIHRV